MVGAEAEPVRCLQVVDHQHWRPSGSGLSDGIDAAVWHDQRSFVAMDGTTAVGRIGEPDRAVVGLVHVVGAVEPVPYNSLTAAYQTRSATSTMVPAIRDIRR